MVVKEQIFILKTFNMKYKQFFAFRFLILFWEFYLYAYVIAIYIRYNYKDLLFAHEN